MRGLFTSTVVILCGLAFSWGASAATNTWTDSFDAVAFDARWGEDEPNPAAGTVSLDTNKAVALFESFGDINMWVERKDAPILWTAAPADNFAFETHVAVSTSQVGSVAGLTVYGSDGERPSFSFGLDNWQAGNRIVKFQGLGNNNPSVFRPAPDGEAWLRLSLYRGSGVNGFDRYVAQYKLVADDPWSLLHVHDGTNLNARIGLVFKASTGGKQAAFSYAAMTELPGAWTDLFDGMVFDARWAEDEPNPALGSVSLDTNNAVAHFEATAELNMWTGRANAPILWTTPPAGDFSLETRVAMSPTQHFAQAGITVYDNNNGLPNFVYCLDHWQAASHQVRLQGLGDNNPNIAFPATGGEAWLRLVVLRDGGGGGLDRYLCQYKLGASNAWSTLTAYDIDTRSERVGLFFKTNGGERTADFSYAAMAALGPMAAGDVIKLDFSTAGDADGGLLADWNQVGAAGNAIPAGGVVRHGDAGLLAGVAITFTNFVVNNVNNDANAGGWTGTTGDPYYVLGADDIYFHGKADDFSATFSGLSPNLGYNVRVYSLIGSAPGNTERFVVTDRGGTLAAQNTRAERWSAAALEAAGTVFTGVTVNAEREVIVTVEDVNSVHYPLNAIVLESVARPPTPPAVTNAGATDVMAASAALCGEVTGGSPIPLVTIHWWEAGNATNALDMGEQWTSFATDLSGLSLGTEYRYYCVASNVSGVATSATESFSTSATGIVPVVTAIAATNITTSVATVGGEVTAGDPVPEVKIYWGLTGNLTNAISMGTQSGSFSNGLTGLTENTSYGYYLSATNLAGVGVTATNFFTTDVSATIVYVDAVQGSEAQFWRTAATNKTMDIDRDNIYGTLGAVHWARGSTGQMPVGSATLGWAFVGGGNQVNLAGYAVIDHITLPGSNTTAGIRVPNFLFEHTGVSADYEGKTVRVGVMADVLASGEWAGDNFKALRVTQLAGGNGDSGVIPLRGGGAGDGVVGMHFFDITNVKPGDRFAITGLRDVGGTSGSSGYVGPISWDIAVTVPPSYGTLLIVR